MNRKLILCVLLVSLILPLRSSFGDMGQVTAYDAQLSETSQKAITLRFIPFATEPQLSLAPTASFEIIAGLPRKIFNLQAKLGR